MDPEEARKLNEALFDQLTNKHVKTPDDEFIETAFLEPFFADKEGVDGLDSMFVMADWLDDHGRSEDADKVRAVLTAKQLRDNFIELRKDRLLRPAWYRNQPSGMPSVLDLARQEQRRQVLRVFPWFLETKFKDSVNEFTRKKLQEDGMYRRIMPPMEISDEELGADVIVGTPITRMDFS